MVWSCITWCAMWAHLFCLGVQFSYSHRELSLRVSSIIVDAFLNVGRRIIAALCSCCEFPLRWLIGSSREREWLMILRTCIHQFSTHWEPRALEYMAISVQFYHLRQPLDERFATHPIGMPGSIWPRIWISNGCCRVYGLSLLSLFWLKIL